MVPRYHYMVNGHGLDIEDDSCINHHLLTTSSMIYGHRNGPGLDIFHRMWPLQWFVE